MKTTKTKNSPKKANIADTSHRTFLTIEFYKQNLLQDVKNWNEQLTSLELNLDRIEKACRQELEMKPQELSKEFLSTQTKIAKINKEIENSQKQANKSQVKFETKILEPFSQNKFSNQSQTALDETKVNIEKTQALFTSCKELTSPVTDRCINVTKRLNNIEDNVNNMCLSNDVDEAVKINSKLNERMEIICKETAIFLEQNASQTFDPKKISGTFLQLYKAHQDGEKLLDQIQKNLHITEPSVPLKENNNNFSATSN